MPGLARQSVGVARVLSDGAARTGSDNCVRGALARSLARGATAREIATTRGLSHPNIVQVGGGSRAVVSPPRLSSGCDAVLFSGQPV